MSHFVELGLDAHGIDLSSELIKVCKQNPLIADRVSIGNILEIDQDFEAGTFDGIWMF